MPTKKDEAGDGRKKDDTEPRRIKVRTAEKIDEIVEVTDEKFYDAVDRLLGPSLAAEHKAIQPQLKKARELKAKLAEVRQQARKDRGG